MSDSAFGRIDGSPELRALFGQLLDLLDTLGPYQVQYHKSSVHLVRRNGFLSVAPGEQGLRLSIVGSDPSGARTPDEVTIEYSPDFDDSLTIRLTAAYLAAG